MDGYNGQLSDERPTLGVNCGLATGRNGVISFDRATYNQGQNAQYDMGIDDSGTAQTVIAKGPGGVCFAETEKQAQPPSMPEAERREDSGVNGTLQYDAYKSLNSGNVVREHYIVRRLTPTECARLQGMPDWWCADVPHSDSAEYKMWGNGMALPCVLYVMEGVAEYLKTKEADDG